MKLSVSRWSQAWSPSVTTSAPAAAQLVVVAFGQAAAVAGVLAVDDDEIEAVVGDEAGEALGDGITAGASDDVAQEQKSHAGACSKWRAPCSVTMASSGTSCASRGMSSSSCAAKAMPTRRGRLGKPFQRAVVVAAAIAEARAAPVEAEERHDDDIGLDLRGEFGRREGAEAGFVERRALFPEAQFERLFVAEDDGQADGLKTVHQADEDGLAVHLVLDAPVAGDDFAGREGDGSKKCSATALAASERVELRMAARLAWALMPQRGLCFFDRRGSAKYPSCEIQVPPWPWEIRSREPTDVGGRRVSEPTGPVRDSSLKDR